MVNLWRLALAALIALALNAAAIGQGLLPGAGIDCYGDLMPPGALVRLGTTRLQTKGGFAWVPDGKSLVTLKHGKVTFWDIADGRALDSFYVPVGLEQFSTYGAQLALSLDGKRLVCTDTKGNIAVCSGWAEGRVSTVVTPGTETDNGRANLILAVLPSGKTFVTLRQSGELEFRDLATMAVQRTVRLAQDRWRAMAPVALSPDGKMLALANLPTRSIVLVNTTADEEPVVIGKAHKDVMYGLTFLPDGTLLTSASIRRDPAKGAANKFQGEVRLWNVAKREATGDWPLDESTTGCSLAVSPDGTMLVTVSEGRIEIWDIKTKTSLRRIEDVAFWNPQSAQVEIDPTGKYLAIDDHQNYVRIWELATGKPMFGEGEHEQGLIFSAAWTPDGKTIATSSRNDIFLWNSETGKVAKKFPGPRWGAAGMLFTPDGRELIATGQDPDKAPSAGAVWWRDPLTGKTLRKAETTGVVRFPALSPDGSLLAFNALDVEGAGVALEVVETATGQQKLSILGQGMHGLAWAPDGKSVFATSGQSTVVQTHLETKAVVSQFNSPHQRRDPHTGALVPSGLARSEFFRSGTRVITAGGLPELYCWDLTTGRKLWTVAIGGDARVLALSPDEKVIACVAGRNQERKLLQLFDVATQQPLAEFDLGNEHSQTLAFSPDGRRLLVGFADGTALVMDATLRP